MLLLQNIETYFNTFPDTKHLPVYGIAPSCLFAWMSLLTEMVSADNI